LPLFITSLELASTSISAFLAATDASRVSEHTHHLEVRDFISVLPTDTNTTADENG
jgi:hypothetical protein